MEISRRKMRVLDRTAGTSAGFWMSTRVFAIIEQNMVVGENCVL
jgi:hypothetical protein